MTDKQLNSLLEAENRDLRFQRDHALETVQRLTNALIAIRRHIKSSEDSNTPLAWEIWDITHNALLERKADPLSDPMSGQGANADPGLTGINHLEDKY